MKKSVSIIGLGNRGTEYMGFLKSFHSSKVEIHSICDIRQQALDDIAPIYGIPKERQYLSPEEFFAKGVLSDGLIIATQDASHFEITKAALNTGYKLILLEKPVSGVEEEYKILRDLANEKGALLLICHVLRYSNYYRKIKEVIEEILNLCENINEEALTIALILRETLETPLKTAALIEPYEVPPAIDGFLNIFAERLPQPIFLIRSLILGS